MHTCMRSLTVCLLALEDDGLGAQLVYAGHLFLTWKVTFHIRIFCFVFVHVIFTSVHTVRKEYLYVSPRIGSRHLESPKNSDEPNISIHVSVYVYEIPTYVYTPPKDGEIALWSATNGSIPDFLCCQVVNPSLLRSLSTYILVSYWPHLNLNMKVIKILYHWTLLLDWFRYWETHFTTYQRFVHDQSAISPSLGGMGGVLRSWTNCF